MDMTSTGNYNDDVEIILNPSFPGQAYLPLSRVHIVMSDVMAALPKIEAPKQISIKVKNTSVGASGKIYNWGDDNLYPEFVVKTARKNGIIPSIIDKFSRAIYGSGLVAGVRNDAGNFVARSFKEFSDFKRVSDPLTYLHRASRDYLYFNQPLPEFTLANDRKKITGLSAQHSAHVRWEKMDTKAKINYGYINAQWADVKESDETTVILPVIHQGYDPVGQIQNLKGKAFNVLFKYQVVSELEYYYPNVDWHSVISSGWVDVANDIPQFKRYLMRNLATVNYMIFIKDWYWRRRFAGFDNKTEEEKIDCRKKVYKELNSFITGIEMSGKSLVVDVWSQAPFYDKDPTHGESFSIKAVNTPDFSGKYNSDLQEANTMIMFAMGLDPALFGSMPGTERSGGSDKREAYNIWITLIDLYSDIILKPYEIIRDYNNWDPNMEFSFGHSILQTLDKITQDQRQTVNP